MGHPVSEETKNKISKSNFKGGYISGSGYKMLGMRNSKFREHHLVWCSQKENLPFIPQGCVIHHIDGNKINNSPENLMLLDRPTHASLHALMRKEVMNARA